MNIVLDLIGQVCNWFSLVGELEGKGWDEDQVVFLCESNEFWNVLLVEQENEDFVYIIVW